MRKSHAISRAFLVAIFAAAVGGGVLAKIHLAPVLMFAVVIGTVIAVACCVRIIIVYCVNGVGVVIAYFGRSVFGWLPKAIRGPALEGFWLGLGFGAFAAYEGAFRDLELTGALLRIFGAGIVGAAVFGVVSAVSNGRGRQRPPPG